MRYLLTALLLLISATAYAEEITVIKTNAACRFEDGQWAQAIDAIINDHSRKYMTLMSMSPITGCLDRRIIGAEPAILKVIRPMHKFTMNNGQCMQAYLVEDATETLFVTWLKCDI